MTKLAKNTANTSVLEAILGAEAAEAASQIVGNSADIIITDEVVNADPNHPDNNPPTDDGFLDEVKTELSEAPTEEPAKEEPKQEPAKAPTWGAFKIEVGVAPPKTAMKYPWADFPAPTDPSNPATWPSVFIPDALSKTIYGSIQAYKDAFQKEHGDKKEAPEFTVSVVKEPKGVRVFRKS
jgi:hypothetical protein